ncbi:MAG: glycosyltransferase family 39 protein [Planctomycetes bacterium]|nr:glycosyltransferase family 39 protein [Planctomycetota bacterium]
MRSEYAVGADFLRANGVRSFWLLAMARWACIPFSLIGGYVCYRWARELYGVGAGIVALSLWCFSPYILGHAALVTPDAPAAAMGILACYVFWRWLRCPDWSRAMGAGFFLGVAELTKTTLVVLFPAWVLMWLLYRWPELRQMMPARRMREAGMLVTQMVLSVYLINVGYGFEGSLQRLGDYRFRSRILSDARGSDDLPAGGENRFRDTWLDSLPVPLPRAYLQGIDTQKFDFERKRWSYLRGEWRMGGWWYYYLYALGIKVPLGTWALVVLAMLTGPFDNRPVASWRDEMILLFPFVLILVFVSSQIGFSIHSRYVIPVLPFLFVWAGKAARSVVLRRWKTASMAGLALCWSVGAGLVVYPHNLSYFNGFAGGPAGGHYHLLDSNVAWGQDLSYLKHWLERHQQATPFYLASFGDVDPTMLGIRFEAPPVSAAVSQIRCDACNNDDGPQPGWFAMDVNHLHGSRRPLADGRGGWKSITSTERGFSYFERFEPVAMAGYSIYIYHITLDDVNRVRRELGLPHLPRARDGGVD